MIHVIQEYGSCSLFQEYELVVGQLENTQLRSSNIDYAGVEDELVQESEGMNSLDDLLVPDVFVAIAADKKSIETFFIIKITIGE